MIHYRNATLEDMAEIAQVHVLTQPEYFTSTLGVDLLSKFYTEFFLEDGLFILACDERNGRIVGFCMGYYFGSRAEKTWEQKYRKEIIQRLMFKCLQMNRLAISRCFRRVKGLFCVKKLSKNKDVYFSHLLSLGVLTEHRGQHIASNLIDRFESKCMQNASPESRGGGYKRNTACTIGAYKWNTAGCKLYEYKGYKVYKETRDKLKFVKELIADEN